MSGAEPILESIPPEASKYLPPAKSSPPTSEVPKGEIKVEVRQPEMLYIIAKNIVNGQSRSLINVSSTIINGSLINKEETRLNGFEKTRGSGEDIDGTFHFNSHLRLSEERVGQADHGYFSYEKVQEIKRILTSKGLEATFSKKWGGRSFITIKKDGQYIEVSFGLPNREAEEASIRKEVEADRKRNPNKAGYAEKHDLPKIEKGLVNKSISLTQVSKSRVETDWEGYPKLENETNFCKSTAVYAEVYEHVINAIYEEEGINPPDALITLRPPITSADIFTQIKSVEAPTPTIVTKEQLQLELGGFDEIAGQEIAVTEAKRLVLAINHPEIFEKRGVKRPKGILFYGPPGTGKTMIAKAIARDANAAFLEISAADIGTKWYGESERLMQRAFDIANKTVEEGKKVVLFIDELDSLAPTRDNVHEATRKVVATLLQNMDGIKANPNVTLIAATNRPQDIDPALKRPGRIDKLIFVGLPNAKGRSAILNVHMEKARKSAKVPDELFLPEINLERLGQFTDGMSGADLANLVNLVLENKVMAELEGTEWTPVSTDEMMETAKSLGLMKKEKRKIGFTASLQNGRTSTTSTEKQL